MTHRRLLVVAVALLFLHGCTSIVSIPVSNPEPLQGRFRILLDSSTREHIVSILGQPHLKLQKDRFWVYGQTRITWEKVPPPDEHDYHALLIEFENDLVARSEKVGHKYSFKLCWSNDMCLEPHWVPMKSEQGPKQLDRRFSAVTSRGDDDREAKLFSPGIDTCSIYIYKEFDLFQLPYPPTVTLGIYNDEPVPHTGYLNLGVARGQHLLRVDDESVSFDCNKDSLIFFAVSNHGFVRAPGTEVRRVSVDKGKREVLERRLLITW